MVSSPTTGPPVNSQVKPNLWDEAMTRLSDEDKAWINGNAPITADSAYIRQLITLVDQQRQACEDKRWKTIRAFGTTICFSDLASNAIAWLNKFKEIGDTIVQYDPGHAALPWAAVRFILQSAVSYEEHMAFILISIEKTARIIHRCQIYELLYNRDTLDAKVAAGLEAALVDLYASLLHILARASNFLSKRKLCAFLYSVFRPTEGSDLLLDLEKFENEVIKEADVCKGKRSAESDSKTQEQLEKLQSLLQLEGRILLIDENVQRVLERMEFRELIGLLEWISPIEYNRHHNLVREMRTKNTLGTGKTFITSRVIDLVAESLGTRRNHEGFAFFYCNKTEPTRRQALSVLRSFVRQLSSPSSTSGHVHCGLKKLYFESKLNGSGWTLDLCKKYLIELFNFYPHTTIILDALDECEIEERGLLLDILDWASKSSSRPVKIFISSRPEGDIRQRLAHLPNLEISARNNSHDIEKFIKESADSLGPWSPALERNKTLKEEIIQTLIEKSDGMFQWARLQVDQLRVIEHEKDLRARLGRLPKDLKSSYDEIYQRIQDRHEYSRVRTLRALMWVMASVDPLSTEELLGAIRVDPDAEEIDEPGEVTEEQLLGWCANLLLQDRTMSRAITYWRPCHLSVVEYLEGRFTMPAAHLFVTMANLVLLIVQPDEEDSLSYLQDYARRLWMAHVRLYDKPDIDFGRAPYDRVTAMMKRFLGSPTQSSDAYVRWANSHKRFETLDGRAMFSTITLKPTSSPLFCVCALPVFYPLRDWWESDNVEFDHLAVNREGESLLTIAAGSGCLPICDSLIRRGTPVNPEQHDRCYGSPLAAAAGNGHAHIVKVLLERGAQVDLLLRGGDYGSALATAHDESISRLLIDQGADVNLLLEAGNYGSALAATHTTNMTQLLIDRGADVNMVLKAGNYGSALAYAVYNGGMSIAKLLIEKGADVNLPLPHGDFGTALIAAASRNNPYAVELLVEHGADVNHLPTIGRFGSALIAASDNLRTSQSILKFLIKKGAEVNAIPKTGGFGSALAAAVRYGTLYTPSCVLRMNFLIKNGADVNLLLPTGPYGSALISAATFHIDVCRGLVEKGADVHLRVPHGLHRSPLIAAMRSGSGDVVRFFLDKGVEVDHIPDGEGVFFGTALIAGAYWRFTEGVQMLLEAGAQVNLRTEVGRFGTALAAARTDLIYEEEIFARHLWRYHEEHKLEVEELLLKHGATE
ncbi:hypothetical protein N0V84_001853 [Fusarium piperis]|uniref:NACHT domain-containing protein n=1 Tax=Fusarium piperis TaxID=1435070 RepID=A0A9W8WKI8_9HYPO|nr:hypothetical protein N0V84_001853 [Fusarium piperis]